MWRRPRLSLVKLRGVDKRRRQGEIYPMKKFRVFWPAMFANHQYSCRFRECGAGRRNEHKLVRSFIALLRNSRLTPGVENLDLLPFPGVILCRNSGRKSRPVQSAATAFPGA